MRRLPRLLATFVVAAVSALTVQVLHATTLIRVTPEQYRRTIHQVFGEGIVVEENKIQPGFRDEGLLAIGERKLTITSAELEQYEKVAQQIAAQVVEPRRRPILVQCAPKSEQAADDVCTRKFLARAGRLLLRRPLQEGELRTFVAIQNDAATRLHSFNAGLAQALARMLVDPELLFRVERSEADPADAQRQRLDPWSKASRLSFFIWDGAPDAQLLTAAENGKLGTEQGLGEQVDRMLKSPRVEYGLRSFFTDMLGFDKFATLSKDTLLYPKFTKNVQEDAQEQTLRTIVDQLLNKQHEYRDLFVTRETFLTPALAALYGVPLYRSQELGGAVPWVSYRFEDSDPHVGILSHVSFLALNSHPARTSPTLRGKALREVFLCQKVPPPPGNVNFNLVQDTTNPKFKTVRQRLTAHSTEAMCAGCHKITDPMGLSLEKFSTVAGFRAQENGTPIDATGTLNGKQFDGLSELAQVLRDDPATTRCLVTRAFSYGTARNPTAEERKWLGELQSDLSSEGVRWTNLIRRIALSPQFFAVPAIANTGDRE